jgi:hypothetical protein
MRSALQARGRVVRANRAARSFSVEHSAARRVVLPADVHRNRRRLVRDCQAIETDAPVVRRTTL